MSTYIELKERCESQMRLQVCNGCRECELKCAAGVPVAKREWEALQGHLAALSDRERETIRCVEAQDKTVDLGDGVSAQMCRYLNRDGGGCAVYAARPLICRLLGHVEWLPCPIEKVPQRIATPDALSLMQSYAQLERRTFEAWESGE